MSISEKELEDIIYDDLMATNGKFLRERGLKLDGTYTDSNVLWVRQLNLEPYGIADIVGFWRDCGTIMVSLIELKAVPIHADHIDQVLRYKTAIEEYLMNTFRSPRMMIAPCLIGPSIESGHYIQNNMALGMAEFSLDMAKGIQFESHSAFSHWQRNGGVVKSFRKQKKDGRI